MDEITKEWLENIRKDVRAITALLLGFVTYSAALFITVAVLYSEREKEFSTLEQLYDTRVRSEFYRFEDTYDRLLLVIGEYCDDYLPDCRFQRLEENTRPPSAIRVYPRPIRQGFKISGNVGLPSFSSYKLILYEIAGERKPFEDLTPKELSDIVSCFYFQLPGLTIAKHNLDGGFDSNEQLPEQHLAFVSLHDFMKAKWGARFHIPSVISSPFENLEGKFTSNSLLPYRAARNLELIYDESLDSSKEQLDEIFANVETVPVDEKVQVVGIPISTRLPFIVLWILDTILVLFLLIMLSNLTYHTRMFQLHADSELFLLEPITDSLRFRFLPRFSRSIMLIFICCLPLLIAVADWLVYYRGGWWLVAWIWRIQHRDLSNMIPTTLALYVLLVVTCGCKHASYFRLLSRQLKRMSV